MSDNAKPGFRISVRLLTIILVVALLISYIVFERLSHSGVSPFRVNIIVPWGLIAVFISFYLFNESNRVKKAKREERREYMNERRQQILDGVIKPKNKISEAKSQKRG
jgi:hypothetical protein